MKEFTDRVTERVADLILDTLDHMEKYAPVNELTRRKYTGLMGNPSGEAELQVLRDKYGDDKVYNWVKRNQERDNG